MNLAPLQDGIPVVANSTVRDARFPVPDTNQRVYNLSTDQVERYTGAAWVPVAAGVGNVLSFGAVGDGSTDDHAAVQAAINAVGAGGTILFPYRASGYKIGTTLAVTNPVTIVVENCDLLGPETGFIIENRADDFQFEGRGEVWLRVSATATGSLGSFGCIKTVDADRVKLSNYKQDLGSRPSCIGTYHLGGWYLRMQDMWTDKNTEHNTTSLSSLTARGLRIESKNADAGDGESGVFVCQYDQVTVNRLEIVGSDPHTATTLQFNALDCSYIVGDTTRALLFNRPVVQKTNGGGEAYAHIDFANVAGATFIGGDYEGAGPLYRFDDECRNIVSLGNQAGQQGGFTGDYIDTAATLRPPGSIFWDDNASSRFFTDGGQGTAFYENMSLLEGLYSYILRANGWTVKHRFGTHYSGDTAHLSVNATATDATHAALDDTSKAGLLLSVSPTSATLQQATAGSGSRTLINALQVDSNTTAGETRLKVYDITGATLQRVSIGAADSGGTGYRVLRIPN